MSLSLIVWLLVKWHTMVVCPCDCDPFVLAMTGACVPSGGGGESGGGGGGGW